MIKFFQNKTLPILFVLGIAVLVVFAIAFLNNGRSEAGVRNEQQTELIAPSQQQTGSVTVKVQNYVSPEGKKCYQYTVENNADRPVVGVDVGLEQASDQAELNTLPDGWLVAPEEDYERSLVEAANSTSLVEVIVTEEQVKYFVKTKVFRANSGETRGFHVCMTNDWDSSYQTAHWVAYLMGGSDLAGQVINLGPM